MRRQGDISPTLWFFQTARLMAKSLEEYKPKMRSAKTAAARTRAAAVCADCERTLDKAWDTVGEIAVVSGDEAAGIVAAHFLFLEDWYTVSADRGLPYDLCKRKAYEAIKRMDKKNEQGMD